jgi:hypothetical protein
MKAILGATTGVYVLENNNLEHLGLESEEISAIYCDARLLGTNRILAGSYESGLFLSEDLGAKWQEVTDGFGAICVRWLGPDPLNSDAVLAGTEPARIFRSTDGGSSWSELDGIRDIPSHEQWYLPYSPRAGAVRNIYTPPGDHRYLASVEVGGLLESRDGGESWDCHPVGVDSDIHFVTGHPADSTLLFTALGYAGIDHSPNPEDEKRRGGVARSTDGGSTWTKLLRDYTRGVIIPTSDPEIVIAGPAPNVGRNGRIEVSRDRGETWEDASSGIETPMSDMVEEFLETPSGSVWAICSRGRLLEASPNELVWRDVLDNLQVKVKSVTFLE